MDLPRQPLAAQPAGYVSLGHYSSLGTLQRYFNGAERAGRLLSLVRGDNPETARRRVSGYTLDRASFLLDAARLERSLNHGFEPHPTLVAFLSGDPRPLRAVLDESYLLHVDFVLALTRSRELIARPEFTFQPKSGAGNTLPAGTELRGRRLSKDELSVLLSRACGL